MANYTKLPLNLSLLSMHLAFSHRTFFFVFKVWNFTKKGKMVKLFATLLKMTDPTVTSRDATKEPSMQNICICDRWCNLLKLSNICRWCTYRYKDLLVWNTAAISKLNLWTPFLSFSFNSAISYVVSIWWWPENSYNPTIMYDESCLAKEYGLNRELVRFMRIKICPDRLHQCTMP